MRYKTVIFDLDGTLLDTLGDLAACVNYMLKKYGYSEKTEAEVRRSIGYGIKFLLKSLFPADITEEELNAVVAEYKEYYCLHMTEKTRVFDGVYELLGELKQRGINIAVVTNKYHEAAVKIVKEYFGDSFSIIIGDGCGYARKPAPDAVWAVIDRFGGEKSTSLYVGDSEADVTTARNSGVDCMCVSWGLRERSQLEKLKPEYLIDTPDEFLSVLDEDMQKGA